MEEGGKQKGSPGKGAKNSKSIRKSKWDDNIYRNVKYCVSYTSVLHTDKLVFGMAL